MNNMGRLPTKVLCVLKTEPVQKKTTMTHLLNNPYTALEVPRQELHQLACKYISAPDSGSKELY